jgi:hypothetical protein
VQTPDLDLIITDDFVAPDSQLNKADSVGRRILKLKKTLAKRLTAYEPPSLSGGREPEPALEFPDVSKYVFRTPRKYEPHLIEQHRMVSHEDLQAEFEQPDALSQINWQRLIPDCPKSPEELPDLEFNLRCGDSFLCIFEAADQEQTFVLICGLLLNGLKTNHNVGESFGLNLSGGKIQDSVAIVREFGLEIFGKILENGPRFEAAYSSAAMIRDRELIRYLATLQKLEPIEAELPAALPFQFAYHPAKRMMEWFGNLVYAVKLNAVDTHREIPKLFKLIRKFFENYLLPGKSLIGFLQESNQSKFGNVTNLTEEKIAWTRFWVAAYNGERLVSAFLALVNTKDIVNQYFAPCSEVRNPSALRTVVELLTFIPSLKLKRPIELSAIQSEAAPVIGASRSFVVGLTERTRSFFGRS